MSLLRAAIEASAEAWLQAEREGHLRGRGDTGFPSDAVIVGLLLRACRGNASLSLERCHRIAATLNAIVKEESR